MKQKPFQEELFEVAQAIKAIHDGSFEHPFLQVLDHREQPYDLKQDIPSLVPLMQTSPSTYAPEERAHPHYNTEYLHQREEMLTDWSLRVPGKHVSRLPVTMMGGILGFTYLGAGQMTLRDDLVGERSREVDVHESIHTPDEYETRVLTRWILTKESNTYQQQSFAQTRSYGSSGSFYYH